MFTCSLIDVASSIACPHPCYRSSNVAFSRYHQKTTHQPINPLSRPLGSRRPSSIAGTANREWCYPWSTVNSIISIDMWNTDLLPGSGDELFFFLLEVGVMDIMGEQHSTSLAEFRQHPDFMHLFLFGLRKTSCYRKRACIWALSAVHFKEPLCGLPLMGLHTVSTVTCLPLSESLPVLPQSSH